MSTILINAQIYTGQDVIEKGYVRFEKQILGVGKMEAYTKQDDEYVIDIDGKYVIPGFIDVHSHGGYGYDSMDADPEKISEMTRSMLIEGVTSYFPTTMTQSDEAIEEALEGIKKAKEVNPMIQGIHLEGPFISKEYKGAQPAEYISVADAERMKKWYELSGENIRLVTYAPETGDTNDFEAYCKENNIILSVGHSGVSYETLKKSEVTHVTHLFNGQKGLHHRDIGVSGYGLLEDEVTVEMIVDGFHISKEMVKLSYKAKGADGIELITDSMRAKGYPEGESELGGQKVTVRDKQARLEDGTLAGSVLTFIDAFKNMIDFTECSIEEAVKMSSVNQAREFGLDKKGAIMPSHDADLIILTKELSIEKTIAGGEIHEFN